MQFYQKLILPILGVLILNSNSFCQDAQPIEPLRSSCTQQQKQCDLIGCSAFGKNSEIANRCHTRWTEYSNEGVDAVIKTYWTCYHGCLEQQKAGLCSGQMSSCIRPEKDEPLTKLHPARPGL